MSEKPDHRMYNAVSAGNTEEVRQILAKHPEKLHEYPGVAPSWFHYAARKGHLSVIDVFLSAGLPVDHRLRLDGDTPLNAAVGFSQLQAAKYLLSLKADPDNSRLLIGAINAKTNNFELVKLLVEHGADVNKCWRWGETENGFLFNALSWAINGEHHEIANYLKSRGARLPDESSSIQTKNTDDEIIKYFNKNVGPVQSKTQIKITSSDYPLTIHVIRPSKERNYYTLFTNGMSRESMTVPPSDNQYRFAELAIHLPPDWDLSLNGLKQTHWSWPVIWLKKIALYPHLEKTWLGRAITIFANGDPPKSLVKGCPFVALLLASNLEVGPIHLSDGRMIQIYSLIPIYKEEYYFEKNNDLQKLFQRLDQFGISNIVDLNRRNVAIN